MEITTDMIKELRAATNAGILDCRKALTEANGDFDKAVDWLREKGMATAAKRADREASQGVIELYSHGGGRVGVELRQQFVTIAPHGLRGAESRAGIAQLRYQLAIGDAFGIEHEVANRRLRHVVTLADTSRSSSMAGR